MRRGIGFDDVERWARRRSLIRGASIVVLSFALCVSLALSAGADSKKKIPPSKPIDINLATSEQLQQLPESAPSSRSELLITGRRAGHFETWMN